MATIKNGLIGVELNTSETGNLVDEGDYVECDKSGVHARHIFLFEKFLFIVEPRSLESHQMQYEFLHSFPVGRCRVEDINNISGSSAFQVIESGSPKNSVFMCASEAQKQTWIENITRTLAATNPCL